MRQALQLHVGPLNCVIEILKVLRHSADLSSLGKQFQTCVPMNVYFLWHIRDTFYSTYGILFIAHTGYFL